MRQNLTYRFTRGSDIVDVLAPDHLGERANVTWPDCWRWSPIPRRSTAR
jgi:hypothetical protein